MKNYINEDDVWNEIDKCQKLINYLEIEIAFENVRLERLRNLREYLCRGGVFPFTKKIFCDFEKLYWNSMVAESIMKEDEGMGDDKDEVKV